jgi:hypothetical protein
VSLPTQVKIIERLQECSRLLEVAQHDLAELDEAAVRAKQAYEVAWARAYLRAEGSIEARKAEAVIVTAGEALEAELCAAKVRACRERIRTLGAQLDVGRTLSAAIRSQFQAEAVGQYT